MEVTDFRSKLFVALEQVTAHLHHAQNMVTESEVRTRESELRRFLATSFDAIVVVDTAHRFVGANPVALHLFGISKANIGRFTVDPFIPPNEIPCFDAKTSRFIGREESHGKCNIRRLDGRMIAAEYIVIPSFVPGRHLCRFREDSECPSKKQLAVEPRKNRYWPL